MFSKKNRIQKENDFEKVFKKGKSAKTGLFVLKWVKNGLPESRFAVSVSKKVSLKAVERNKIKRRICSILEKCFFSMRKGNDFLVIVLPGAVDKSFLEIKEDLNSLLLKTEKYQ
jgi:ribonuclease P protein component